MRTIVLICCLLLSGLTELVGLAVLSTDAPSALTKNDLSQQVPKSHHSMHSMDAINQDGQNPTSASSSEHDCCDDELEGQDDCCDGSCENCDSGCVTGLALLANADLPLSLPQRALAIGVLGAYPSPFERKHIPPIV